MRQEEQRAASMLSDQNTTGTPLLVLLIDRFGTAMFDWEPDTLRLEIKSTWGVEPPQENMDKIWALISLITTNLFNVSLEFFIHVSNALSGNGADFANYDPATVQEMCWAITEQHLIAPFEKGEDFSSEILTYMKASLLEEGFSQVPQILTEHIGKDLTSSELVEDGLAIDEIDTNAYWDMQTRKRLDIDAYLVARMRQLIDELAALPLHHAKTDQIKQLQERAHTTLVMKAQEKAQVSESVAPIPFA